MKLAIPAATPKVASKTASVDAVFAQEQRRFRRLEVSLPVWITTEEAFGEGLDVWELGYTRDLSLGGAKIIVPPGGVDEWKAAASGAVGFILKIESGNQQGGPIPAVVRHVDRDAQSGRISLGVQFLAGEAFEARAAAVASGLQTLRARRRWQAGFVLAVVAAMLGLISVRRLKAEVAQKAAQIAVLQHKARNTQSQIAALEKPALVSTRSQGIDRAFRRVELKDELAQLRQNMARLNNPANMKAAIQAREAGAQKLGLSLAPPSSAAHTQLAVAFPYGYNWPLVIGDLESALGRKIPQVVVFRDWSQDFPDLDAREARARAKTLQITWEPWHFSNPGAVKLADIAAGRSDAYIDRFAAGARSFGGEIWMRWGHEMNGNWYPWSLANNNANAKNWLAAYKRIHDRFRRAGASNVRWIWCFNAENVPAARWNDPFSAYPGDDYTDAIAIDGYNFGDTTHFSRWQSFAEIFGAAYDQTTKRFPKKPLLVGETGCSSTGGDKTQWLLEMDKALRGRFRRVESVTWFEAAKEADWRMLSTLETAQTARKIWSQSWYRRGES